MFLLGVVNRMYMYYRQTYYNYTRDTWQAYYNYTRDTWQETQENECNNILQYPKYPIKNGFMYLNTNNFILIFASIEYVRCMNLCLQFT